MRVVKERGADFDAMQADLIARVGRFEAMGDGWNCGIGFDGEDGKNSASAVWILPLPLLIKLK